MFVCLFYVKLIDVLFLCHPENLPWRRKGRGNESAVNPRSTNTRKDEQTTNAKNKRQAHLLLTIPTLIPAHRRNANTKRRRSHTNTKWRSHTNTAPARSGNPKRSRRTDCWLECGKTPTGWLALQRKKTLTVTQSRRFPASTAVWNANTWRGRTDTQRAMPAAQSQRMHPHASEGDGSIHNHLAVTATDCGRVFVQLEDIKMFTNTWSWLGIEDCVHT